MNAVQELLLPIEVLTWLKKEIFARHATPYPVAVPAPNAPSQFSAFLHGLLSQTGIASERREDMEGVIAGKLTGSANAMKKDAEKRSVEEMDAVDDMHVEPKAAERLGEVQDAGAEKQNESQGTGKRWVAGERVQVEKTHTVKVFDGEGRRGGSANSKAVIEKRAVESDRENGGMEVHGQMGSLRGK